MNETATNQWKMPLQESLGNEAQHARRLLYLILREAGGRLDVDVARLAELEGRRVAFGVELRSDRVVLTLHERKRCANCGGSGWEITT